MGSMEQDPPKNLSVGRRVVLRAAGVAFGIAAAAVIFGAGFLWWESRPKPWDTAAITAAFDYVGTEGETQTLVFFYTLENHTDHDYRVDGGAAVTVAARLKEQGSLSPDTKGEVLTAEFPLFVPAHEKILYRLHVGSPYKVEKPLPPDKDQKARRAALAAYVAEEFRNLDGFVLLDSAQRRKVLFPRGW
jgi:hypothetical protein